MKDTRMSGCVIMRTGHCQYDGYAAGACCTFSQDEGAAGWGGELSF